MSGFVFAVKRTLKTPAFLILLVLLCVLPVLMDRAVSAASPQHALYAVEAGAEADTDVIRLSAWLQDAGFERFTGSADELDSALSSGQYDAALLIPGNLHERLSSGDVDRVLTLIVSPAAYRAALFKGRAAAALYAVYAPYISADTLKDTVIKEEEIVAEYDALMQEELRFSFEITHENGRPLQDTERADRFFLGALSILIYLAGWFGILLPLSEDTKKMGARITREKAVSGILVPGGIFRTVLLVLAAAVPCIVTSRAGLLPAVLIYTAAIAVLHTLFSMLPAGEWKNTLVVLICFASLALCPMFTDLALYVPALEWVRRFIPPYWLWGFGNILPF